MVLLKTVHNGGMHITKPAPVALIKDDDDMLMIYRMFLILFDKG